jgi:hypothetical protein
VTSSTSATSVKNTTKARATMKQRGFSIVELPVHTDSSSQQREHIISRKLN